ncbi:MAG: cellulase family glycosylhydrolase [Oscillospiraceae bacterium]|jgi:aryl-phospho-beta-D-glucosidase BglC (GH1 family)|nr:cellulase family glycosylhydrolase [Oscillospiraceae bacterium]
MIKQKRNILSLLLMFMFAVTCLSQNSYLLFAKADNQLDYILSTKSSWPQDGRSFVQLDITVTNTSQAGITNWVIAVPVEQGTVEGHWCCDVTPSPDSLTIRNLPYNGTIESGKSVTFGITLSFNGCPNVTEKEITVTPFAEPPAPRPEAVSSAVAIANRSNATRLPEVPAVSPPGAVSAALTVANFSFAPRSTESFDAIDDTYSGISGKSVDLPDIEEEFSPVSSCFDTDWLFTHGNKIVDAYGNPVRLTGLNWFGFNATERVLHGLWSVNLEQTVSSIADKGFNIIRVPISVELIKEWQSGLNSYPGAVNLYTNPNLIGKTSLDIFEIFLDLCSQSGLKVLLDIHHAAAENMGHMHPVWYTDAITTNDYYSALAYLAGRYADDDTIVAYDLKNEPHGKAYDVSHAKWHDDVADPDNWKAVAEEAARRVLAANPNVLVVIEGVETFPKDIGSNRNSSSSNPEDYYSSWWGANLRGVKHFPINLGEFQNKLLYSTHDYGPAVSPQPWFHSGFTYDSILNEYWLPTWLYIHEENIAPVFIGEWGGRMIEENSPWMQYIKDLIINKQLSHTHWCLNPNSGDTGGLLLDDWVTWDEEKYEFVKGTLWQKDGKFIGLSCTQPLGENGLTRYGAYN